MKKIDWVIILFLILISVIALRELFQSNFYTSHDGTHQVVRLYYFDKLIKEGQIPPRWVGDLMNGFGYPLFIFSYQMPWLIAEPIHLLGTSVFDSIKITFLLTYIFSGIAMYIFLTRIFGRWEAVAGTIIYLFAPYRFSNIFVRGAIGDATSFVFPPITFLSIYSLCVLRKISWRWI